MEAHAIPPRMEWKDHPRHFGGRRVHPGELISYRHRWWHAIAARAWVLLLPLLGFALADVEFVRSTVKDAGAEKERAIHAAAAQSADLALRIAQARVGASRTQAAIEAEFLPRLADQWAVLDSLALHRRAAEGGPAACQARIDSLRTLQQGLMASAERAARDRLDRDASLADLRSQRAELQDSLALFEQTMARTDEQVRRQEEHRRHQEILGYVWYVLGPCLGVLWAQES